MIRYANQGLESQKRVLEIECDGNPVQSPHRETLPTQ